MKIAIPTKEGGLVDNHFGHCKYYTIYTVENNQIVETGTLPSPVGCGCKSGVAVTLQEIGVNVMLAGSMGDGAKRVLESNNIKVIRGCSGNIDSLITSFLAGEINDSGEGCSSHGEDHVCSNH